MRTSKCELAAALPVRDMNCTCSGSHVSSVQERTLEMCTPRPLCMPARARHHCMRSIPAFCHGAASAESHEPFGRCRIVLLSSWPEEPPAKEWGR